MCSALSTALGILPEYLKAFYYSYSKNALIFSFWGFKESLSLAFGRAALVVIFLTPDPTKPLSGPAISALWIFSPAHKAGLQMGDIFIQADDINIYDQHQLVAAVEQHNSNEPMKIKILWQNQEKIVYVNFR